VEKLSTVWFDGADDDVLDRYDRQRRTVAQEYLQKQTIENKRNIEEKDPQKREAFYQELRDTLADPDRLRTYLRRITMIEGFERAASID
jgi:3-(3-hydroxy-phenyl)propionate hydroxylase